MPTKKPKLPRLIYIVMGQHGEYSDHEEWPVCAYTQRRAADAHVDRCTRELAAAKMFVYNKEIDVYDLMESVYEVTGVWGRPDTPNERRKVRRELARRGLDVPSDPEARGDHLLRASWYVMGPVQLIERGGA